MNEAEARTLVNELARAVAFQGDAARIAACDKVVAALVAPRLVPSLATPAELNDIISGVLRVNEGWANTHYMDVAKRVDVAAVLRVVRDSKPNRHLTDCGEAGHAEGRCGNASCRR